MRGIVRKCGIARPDTGVTGVVIAVCLLLLLAAAATGCGNAEIKQAGAKSKRPGGLLIASASDMKFALPKIAGRFKRKAGGDIKLDLGSSGLLARQIEQGAPFDIFISANKTYMNDLVKKGLIKNQKYYARGAIVLVGKAKTLEELKGPGIRNIAIANPETAPYGAAAKDALEKAGVWDTVKSKVVIGESIAHAYDFFETGNVDAAIVALSLVKTTDTNYVRIHQDLYRPIEQWAGVVVASKSKSRARSFIDYLFLPSTQDLLAEYGFEMVRTPK